MIVIWVCNAFDNDFELKIFLPDIFKESPGIMFEITCFKYFHMLTLTLTLPMLRLLSSKAQGRKDF